MANIKHVNSVVDRDFRNRINQLIDVVNSVGTSIDELVVKGVMTPEQYSELITAINGLVKSGEINLDTLSNELKNEIEKINNKVDKGNVSVADINKNLGKLDQTFLSDELLQQIAGTAPINAVPADGSITTNKLADKSINNAKLSDYFSSARVLTNGENITQVNKEGLYFISTMDRHSELPSSLVDGGLGYSGFLIVKPYSKYHYLQELHDLNNSGVTYSRVVKNNVNSEWKVNSDDIKVKKLTNEEVNNKLQYNLNVFERYANEVIPDKNIAYANAIQDIRIEGVDPDVPVKIWTLCRAFNTWNYRIILGKYEDGVWSTLLDTGINYTVTESEKGATNIEYSAKGITLKARIDYNNIPKNDRILDHSTITDEPYFIIRPEKVGVPLNSGSGGKTYNQSLNTTDNVRFASIKTDALDVSGTMQTGTLSNPPKVSKGDMWLDTTDSGTHPVLRVML